MEKVNQFTFCVLVYNHQEYILEHLESIKFLIQKYSENVTCNIIINDDCSKDKSRELMDSWLNDNNNLFGEVIKIYNASNLGTCASVVNIVEKIKTKHCKITAGDDVYSFYDIFSFVSSYDYDLLSGIPVRLIDGKVEKSFFEVFNYIASDRVYKNTSLTDRLINVSVINAPNMFYSIKYLKDVEIMDFVKKFDVVEDWPLQIAISLKNKSSKLISSLTPIVYYRRTLGSTFLVASDRFVRDQVAVFDYLTSICVKEKKFFNVIVLENRKSLFLKGNKFLKAFFNLSRAMYFLKVILNIIQIIKSYRDVSIDLSPHQKHVELMKSKTLKYCREL